MIMDYTSENTKRYHITFVCNIIDRITSYQTIFLSNDKNNSTFPYEKG